MLDQSQTCPSCRSSKYSNPQLRLMVNTCGHSLCENCVEVLFVRGSGLCVQCKAPIRKVNFRYQLFEDPLVQKEVEIRKKLLSDFNKREEDFATLEEYDLYLEKIEELVYNLMNDIDVDECKRYIENYKKENKEIIKKNRLKPSSSMLFYEAELEREQLLREKREKEDEERRQNLLKGIAAASAASNAASEPQFVSKPSPSVPLGRPTTTTNLAPPTIKPPASVLRPPPSQFYSPATSSRIPVDRVFIPPPPSALGGGLPVPPSACPPTMSGWIPPTSYHHHEVFLPPSAPTPRQPDAVVLPGRSMQTRSSTRTATGPPAFIYVPHEFEMCGPSVPDPKQSRWADILSIYTNAVIYPRLKPNVNAILSSAEDIKPDLSQLVHLKSEDELDVKKRRVIPGDEIKKEESDSPRTCHIGLSHDLPPGACGIAPRVFLERWLQESRCGLFL